MITYEKAREVASWWQSPGTDGKRFAEFASTGMVRDRSAFLADIEREKKGADDKDWFWLEELRRYLDELD